MISCLTCDHKVRGSISCQAKATLLRDVLFIVRAGNNIIKADFMYVKRTTFPAKIKIGIHLEEPT